MTNKFLLTILVTPFIINGCTSFNHDNLTQSQALSTSNLDYLSTITTSNQANDSRNSRKIYLDIVRKTISNNWQVPANTEGQRAIVSSSVSENGVINNIAVSSENENLRQSLLRAIQQSNPLPIPPSNDYESLKKLQINFVAR